MIWVGRLGAASVAGVGVGSTIYRLLATARQGLSVGQRAMVSRFVGADDIEGANHAAMQAFLLNVVYAIFTIVMGVILAKPMMRLMGVEPDVARAGANYLRIMMFGQAAMSFRMMGYAAMEASGDTVTPMKIGIITRIFHVIFAPFLIFGWLGLPRLEVSGAALANSLTAALAAAVAIWVLASGHTRLHLRLTWRFSRGTIWEMLKIGFPASINSAERNVARTLITRILVTFGTYGVAAHVIAQRVDMIAEIMAQALAQAAGILVGQNLGAGRPDRSYRSAWAAMGFGVITATLLTAIIFWQAENFIRIFNPDPELVRIGSPYVRVLAAQFASMCGAIVFSQALNGAGDTVPPMISSILTLWGIELPLAYFLPKITGWGLYGVPAATVAATSVRVLLYMSFFQWGKWREKQISIEADGQVRVAGRRGPPPMMR